MYNGQTTGSNNCLPTYAPLAAARAIEATQLWQAACPRTQIILRGLGPQGGNYGLWPNANTVVRFRCPASCSWRLMLKDVWCIGTPSAVRLP